MSAALPLSGGGVLVQKLFFSGLPSSPSTEALTCVRTVSTSHHAPCHQSPPERQPSTDPMVMAPVAVCSALMNASFGPADLQAAMETNDVPPVPSASLMILPNLSA